MERLQPKNPNRTRVTEASSINTNNSHNLFEGTNSLNKAQSILNTLELDWSSIVTHQFNPVPLALELIDDSSLGRDFNQFEKLLNQVNGSVVEVVNEHYHQFNSTTTIFTGVQTEVTGSQEKVRDMKQDLENCKDLLTTKRSDLSLLWSKTKQYNAMLAILDQLDEIKLVPEKVENLLRDKYYFTALKLLLATLVNLDSASLKPIKATSELRRTLLKIKNTLHDTLIEEIHNHAYLKIHLNHEFEEFNNTSKLAKFQATMSKYLDIDYSKYNLVINPSDKKLTDPNQGPLQELEDLGTDPESDSLHFLRVLVVCIKMLGKLPEALDRIKSRVPVELYQLVDKTIGEVEIKLNTHTSSSFNDAESVEEASFKLTSLADRLFQKFELVLSYHQFIVLLIKDLYSRSNYILTSFQEESPSLPNPTNLNKRLSTLRMTRELKVPAYNIKEVWNSVQSEIRSMLTDYLTDPQLQTSVPNLNGLTSSPNLAQLQRTANKSLDPKKQLFKFTASDLNGDVDSLDDLYDSVQVRIETSTTSLPTKKLLALNTDRLDTNHNLFSQATSSNLSSASNTNPNSGSNNDQSPAFRTFNRLTVNLASVTVDKYALHSQLATEHRLITNPNVYYVSILVPSCQRFFHRIQPFLNLDQLEGNSKDGNHNGPGKFTFLDEFFNTTLIPQLTIQSHHHLTRATASSNAFKVGPKLNGQPPLLNGFEEMVDLITKLTTTLRSLPFQSTTYLDIVDSVLVLFLDRCQRCYKGVVSTVTNGDDSNSVGTIVSSMWAQSIELLTLFREHPYILNLEQNEELERELNTQEINIEINLKQRKSLHTSELMFDVRRIALLATLSHSLRMFVERVDGMLSSSPTATNSTNLLANFRKLADLSLLTLRVEFRCHAMYYLDLAVREGDYYLSHDQPILPDSYVVSLNSDLAVCQNVLSQHLNPDDLTFVYGGIGTFLSQALISSENVRHIGKMSSVGLQKMFRNLQALKANLTHLNLPDQTGLDLATTYFNLYDLDLESFASRARIHRHMFNNQQFKALLDLTFFTLEFELQIPELKQKHSKVLIKKKSEVHAEDDSGLSSKIDNLILQSYHNQLMELRELEEEDN